MIDSLFLFLLLFHHRYYHIHGKALAAKNERELIEISLGWNFGVISL